MASKYASGLPESRLVKNERKKQVKGQLAKVLALMVVLLLLLLYLVLTNLPQIIAPGNLRFLFSVYRLQEPMGALLDSDGVIYVSEPLKKRILAFSSSGDLLKKLNSGKGTGRVRGIYGAAVDDRRGELYFADFAWRKIHVFNRAGKALRSFPKKPFRTAFGEKGFAPFDVEIYQDKVFVSTRNGIVIFDRRGNVKEVWGRKRGPGVDQFDFANGIAIDKKTGNIYVADSLNRRVVALNQKGQVRWVAGKPDREGKLVSFFSLPRGIDVDDQGRVFVADTFEHRITVLSSKGKLLAILGSRGVEDGKFNFPENLDIGNGRLVVADRGNSRAQIFSLGTNLPKAPSAERRQYIQSFSERPGKFLGLIRRIKYRNDKLDFGEKI